MYAVPTCELSGVVYEALLRFALSRKGAFTLVQRDKMKLLESGLNVVRDLAPFLVSESRVSEWPGTELPDGKHATLRRYRLNARSCAILGSAATSVYEWQQSRLPEDLAFYTGRGDCWFGSIAHERDAFFDTRFVEVDALLLAVPGLCVTMPASDTR